VQWLAKAHMSAVNPSGSACFDCPLGPEPGFRPSKADWPAPRWRGTAPLHDGIPRMSTGTVKWFNATKGYGFIQPEDGTADVFVHISDVQRSGLQGLNDGQRLSFDVQRGQQGKLSACNLKLD
jgi:CspA family cold shock protein